MTPIQLWLPMYFGGVAQPELRRDMQRLFRARTTEHLMWSVPGWSGPSRWTQAEARVSCLNGDHLECVKILHIGENGAVVGPAAAAFPNQSVAGLLDAWLNDEFVRLVPKHTDELFRVKVPQPIKGGVSMVEQELLLRAKHVLPITHAGDRYIAAQWPPSSDMAETVSPELESAAPLSVCRVEEGRGCIEAIANGPVSLPRSSNRTCGFPASGFPTVLTTRLTSATGRARVEGAAHRVPRR